MLIFDERKIKDDIKKFPTKNKSQFIYKIHL